MATREFKDALYGQFAVIGKALASPARLELLDLLAQGERTVEALAREAGLSIANASQHLQVLKDARLVTARKEGSFVRYALAEPTFPLLAEVRAVARAQLADVDRLVRDVLTDDAEPIGRDELLERIREGTVVVLDVRPAAEYAAGHVAGAISVPVDELEARIAGLPKRKEVVAYCRGPYCVYAHDAVRALRAAGRKARRLEDGFPEWRRAGLPVES